MWNGHLGYLYVVSSSSMHMYLYLLFFFTAKGLMYYEFYYFWIPLFGRDNVRLMMTDTDSLLLHIKNVSNIEDLLWENRSHFDFSNMRKDSKLYDESNRMKVGLWKIEYGVDSCYGGETREVTCCKSKVYAIKCVKMTEAYLRNKGVKKKATIHQQRSILKSPQKGVQSSYVEIAKKDFVLTTQTICKTAVTTLNDKFWYHRCLIHSKPIGYPNFTLDCDVCEEDHLTRQEEALLHQD